jgi:hypothetical protein
MTRRHNGFAAYAWIVTPDGRRQRKYVYGKPAAVHDRWLKLVAAARRGPWRRPCHRFVSIWTVGCGKRSDRIWRLHRLPIMSSSVTPISIRALGRSGWIGSPSLQLWMNDLRERSQCCAQSKDAARRRPRCCAAGECCRQIASEWTRHQAWTILQSALSAAVREELVSRNAVLGSAAGGDASVLRSEVGAVGVRNG